ncbi:MAG TPA: cold shock domain-containing protein [Planctomycetota bacterium]|nr:cold shock domain-containing protein [Planctomycetota bacterium]
MPTGRVKWFDNRKGFGFVSGERGEDVFIHYTAIKTDGFRTLNDGELVRFEVIQGPKGLLAKSVVRVSEDGADGAAVTTPPRTPRTAQPSLQEEARRRVERFFESGGAAEA